MIPAHLLAPKHWLTWIGIGCFSILAWLPWQARRWLGKHSGDWLYHHNHKRRHVILTNLRLCFPEQSNAQREQLAQEHLREYASALLDYSLLFFRPRHHVDSRSKITGLEYLETVVHEKKKHHPTDRTLHLARVYSCHIGKKLQPIWLFQTLRQPRIGLVSQP